MKGRKRDAGITTTAREDSRQTAYPLDCRPRTPKGPGVLTDWHDKIKTIYSKGYLFLGYQFNHPGWLYRGASSGFWDFVLSGCCSHFSGDKSVSQLEQQLDIYFVSQDHSDAYSVARFWENEEDVVIEESLINPPLRFKTCRKIRRGFQTGTDNPQLTVKINQ